MYVSQCCVVEIVKTKIHNCLSWMAVEFPAKATAIFKPLGGMSHTEALMLLGILVRTFASTRVRTFASTLHIDQTTLVLCVAEESKHLPH